MSIKRYNQGSFGMNADPDGALVYYDDHKAEYDRLILEKARLNVYKAFFMKAMAKLAKSDEYRTVAQAMIKEADEAALKVKLSDLTVARTA